RVPGAPELLAHFRNPPRKVERRGRDVWVWPRLAHGSPLPLRARNEISAKMENFASHRLILTDPCSRVSPKPAAGWTSACVRCDCVSSFPPGYARSSRKTSARTTIEFLRISDTTAQAHPRGPPCSSFWTVLDDRSTMARPTDLV